jgi:hypothetical protein
MSLLPLLIVNAAIARFGAGFQGPWGDYRYLFINLQPIREGGFGVAVGRPVATPNLTIRFARAPADRKTRRTDPCLDYKTKSS